MNISEHRRSVPGSAEHMDKGVTQSTWQVIVGLMGVMLHHL